MNIGIIGLGNMGIGIATNLLQFCQQHDSQLFVFDINQNAIDQLIQQGANGCESVAELSSQVQILFTSLPSSKEVNFVANGDNGILNNLPKNSIWFETSTNELDQWQKLLDLAPHNIMLIDAPVTGGSEGAANGTLTMLLGREESLNQEISDILASFTNKVVNMGAAGSGYVSKLCQLHLNYLVAQGIGETLMLGAKANLDLNALHDVLSNSCAQSYVVDNYIPKVLDGSYDESFTLGLATKDMRLITGLGQHLHVKMPLAKKVFESYNDAIKQYGDSSPHLSIVKLIEDDSDTKLRSK